ncbi:FtsX-like permease family protein [Tindallia californiensis]|uniref:Putative ABC transport system permease protein n=1 Tax=Tindallia californiensis TaxID=159292 RepID=A0A1H3P7I5_9FIRM|nr:ABC transporter permease [Tindallia californiensis]SDY96933.1 putative ABC transport system permease protein [Tindallia californiensis]
MSMYFKMALKNVKKGFKDYSIYFMTLTLAVCIFYSFNSIGSQKAFASLEGMEMDIIADLTAVIGYLSIFISFIVGGLVIYGNRFLIKRRKKEFGTYMILGMSKWKVSTILVFETLMVGMASLMSGLILGLFVSQGISLFTTILFEIPMKDYAFVLSLEAMKKTFFYFGIVFLVSLLFTIGSLSKVSVLKLLRASKINEEMKIKSSPLYILFFLTSITLLFKAYKLVLTVGFRPMETSFLLSLALGILGTILFFFSFSGLMIFILRKSTLFYLKGINIFTIKQLSSKVNTNFLAMSMITFMLLITISVLSTGLSFHKAMEESFETSAPFDASASAYRTEEEITDIHASLKEVGLRLDHQEQYSMIDVYGLGLTTMEVFALEDGSNALSLYDLEVSAVKLSEYNKGRTLQGKAPMELEKNEVLLLGNFSEVKGVLQQYMDQETTITLPQQIYTLKNQVLLEDNLVNTPMPSLFPTLVFHDEEIEGLPIQERHFNIMYHEDYQEISEKKYRQIFSKYKDGTFQEKTSGFIIGDTRESMLISNTGLTTIVLFLGIYLGIVFLVTSMAILGLQQVSEAGDSIERYRSLKKIGATDQMIHQSIFQQISIQFALPLIVAILHSFIAIHVMNRFIALFYPVNIGKSALITAMLFIVIYSGYFMATYMGYRTIIHSNN